MTSSAGHCLNRADRGPRRRPRRDTARGADRDAHARTSWGWTVVARRCPARPSLRRLGLAGTEQAWLLWEIDADARTATANRTYTRPLAPFLGVTGTAPAAPGEHSTIPPRAESGGNIDCKELVAGSTLYLPVNVPGALLYLGDGHGAQGDGEVCGTAIECPMTTEAVVDLAAGRPPASVHAETQAGRITFGFSADLNEAMGDALDAMVTWLASLYGTSRTEALALASTCVDLRVTQVGERDVGGAHAAAHRAAVGGLTRRSHAGQLGHDVQVAQVPGVLLEQMEQHALQHRRLRARPALAGLADLGQLVALDDGRAARRLFGVRRQQVVQGLVRRDVPAAVALVAPRVTDGAALEAPLQPAPLHVGQVPEQFQRRPARRHDAAAQLAGGQLTQPGGEPVTEVAEVAEEHLRPRPGWGNRRETGRSWRHVRRCAVSPTSARLIGTGPP